MGAKLTAEQKALVATTPLVEDDIKLIKKAFLKVKGKKTEELSLNKEEFEAVFRRLCKRKVNEKVDLEAIFDNVDGNHDGKVSFKEMICWLSIYAKGTEEEKLRHLFAILDENDDKQISGKEIEVCLDILQISGSEQGLTVRESIRQAVALIETVDINDDNVLTIDEWIEIGQRVNLVEQLLGPGFVEFVQNLKIKK
eukprot:TRINITY_DN2732_c0_g1_i1.p1 TRINITY_DN2732_c0_g1~~TRINITY_DN2732_c0_g1_i1.p1  ORF type:complete len:197 (-),score=41.37 TRINITY_DN2732_c0_g1_i1:47-637(-)